MLKTAPVRGFTLVETLVALSILLTGLAGAAAVLLRTVQQERESGHRRAALRLAASMADQLRTVRRPDGRAAFSITGTDPAAACAGDPGNCAAELAAGRLLAEWTADVLLALPQGAAAAVAVPDPSHAQYLIAIEWPSAGGGSQHLELPVTT